MRERARERREQNHNQMAGARYLRYALQPPYCCVCVGRDESALGVCFVYERKF